MKLNQMKVGTRLLGAFSIVALAGAIVAGLGIANMSKINDMGDRIYDRELLGLSYIKEANINLIYIGRSLRSVLLASTEEQRSKSLQRIEDARKELRSNLAEADKRFASAAGRELLSKLHSELEAYDNDVQDVLRRARKEPLQANNELASFVMGAMSSRATAVDDRMSELARVKEKNAADASEETTVLYESSRNFMIMLVVGSALAGLGMGIWITRGLLRQLGGEPADAAQIAARIAGGDLAVDIDIRPHDESSMLFAMRRMRDSLAQIVGQVRAGTDTIATATQQIAAGNQDLSARTEQQAGSLEETASSMEELTTTVKQNADNARQANQLAANASQVATRGGTVVAQVVDTMGSINEASRRIVDIISVIDGIAFQTNILALNAAVEAARAGDQGRGFAVVANEVRSLAHRSADAAKEIKSLIENSVACAESGSKLVDQAGRTMDEVVASITSVSDIMSEITAASAEQSTGIDQVNQAIGEMDHVTQQNAALVEEAAAAAESLQEQASQLSSLVAVFTLHKASASAAIAVAAKEPRKPALAVAAKNRPAPAKPKSAGHAALPQPAPAQPVFASGSRAKAAVVKDQAGEWVEF
ncbi:methyl-accepting chemotaxis protein [Pseudoduganella eburnea]|uniref:Methyl-accepting chemotaxis protein n=1 Tax=Massilia eburnea TaxID=1776165 RepID=A0A6L6QS90_9BURK|nr:methyl-accepting chemotaxis protein [Massilia eburnea]MTW14506.1 methyl-accepting chemotaxis protein [Massilia eburnea]